MKALVNGEKKAIREGKKRKKESLIESAITFDQYNGLQQLCAFTAHYSYEKEKTADDFVPFSLTFSDEARTHSRLTSSNARPPKIRPGLMSLFIDNVQWVNWINLHPHGWVKPWISLMIISKAKAMITTVRLNEL